MRRAGWIVVAVLTVTAAYALSRQDARQFIGETVTQVSNALQDLIAGFEGYSATVYQDAAGLWTIGYGHLVKPGDPYYPHGPISEISRDEAQALLEADTATAQGCVDNAVRVPLSENQRAALVSFVYNVGCGAFQSSTLLRRLNAGEYAAAADELDRWVNAGGVQLAGLVKRRQLEKETFLA